MGWESFGVVGFDLMDPSFEVKRGWPNLKVLITPLLLVLEVWDGKPTYMKSWAGNLLVSDLTLDPSFKVKRGWPNFDLGPLLQGQMRIAKLKSAYNSLNIGPRGLGW